MSIEDYKRNLRGVNDGSDFSPEYLVCFRLGRLLVTDSRIAMYL